ncbi:hypothetical protein EON63_13705 [archaeon]|nr:MAG: hypothetical protein EON63_13705 [archaeon]
MSRRRPENVEDEAESTSVSESSDDDDTGQNTIDEENTHIFEAGLENVLREDIGDSDDSISVADLREGKQDSSDRLFVPSPDNTPFLNVHAKEFVPNFPSTEKESGERKQSVIERVKRILTLYSAGLDGNQV